MSEFTQRFPLSKLPARSVRSFRFNNQFELNGNLSKDVSPVIFTRPVAIQYSTVDGVPINVTRDLPVELPPDTRWKAAVERKCLQVGASMPSGYGDRTRVYYAHTIGICALAFVSLLRPYCSANPIQSLSVGGWQAPIRELQRKLRQQVLYESQLASSVTPTTLLDWRMQRREKEPPLGMVASTSDSEWAGSPVTVGSIEPMNKLRLDPAALDMYSRAERFAVHAEA
eukprot:8634665-Pyramimonas_sp.AAC.1